LVSQTEDYIIHETTTATSSLTVLSNKQNNTTTLILPDETTVNFDTTNTTPKIEYNNSGNIKITTTPKNGEQPSVIIIFPQTNTITTSNSPDNHTSYKPGSNIFVSNTGEVKNGLVVGLATGIPLGLAAGLAAVVAAIFCNRRRQQRAGRQPGDDVAVGNNGQPQQPGASVIGNPSGSSLGGIEGQQI
jgi:hypothetical protein